MEPCTHPQQEYVSCKDGEITWKCTSCGEHEMTYHDTCSGG